MHAAGTPPCAKLLGVAEEGGEKIIIKKNIDSHINRHSSTDSKIDFLKCYTLSLLYYLVGMLVYY